MAFEENIKRGQAFRRRTTEDPVTGIKTFERISFKTLASDVYFDSGRSIVSSFDYAEGFLAQGETSITISGPNITVDGLLDIYVPTEYMHMYPDKVEQHMGYVILDFSSERNAQYVSRPGGVTIKVVCHDMTTAPSGSIQDDYPIDNPYYILSGSDYYIRTDISFDDNVDYYLDRDIYLKSNVNLDPISTGRRGVHFYINGTEQIAYLYNYSVDVTAETPYMDLIHRGDTYRIQLRYSGLRNELTAYVYSISRRPDVDPDPENPYPINNPYHITEYDYSDIYTDIVLNDGTIDKYTNRDISLISNVNIPANTGSGYKKIRVTIDTNVIQLTLCIEDNTGTWNPYSDYINQGDNIIFKIKKNQALNAYEGYISHIYRADNPDPSNPDPYEPIENVYGWGNESTDAQVVSMIQANDLGQIDLTEYWSVGQERTVTLNAMEASVSGLSDTHVAQEVVLVIVASKYDSGWPCNNYHIAFGTSGFSSDTVYVIPTFIIQQKNCLKEYGGMHNSNSNTNTWDSCLRRTWCNSVYKNAFPSSLLSIVKPVIIESVSSYIGTDLQESDDYFFFPTEKEVFGTYSQSQQVEADLYAQWNYFTISSSNCIKSINGLANEWTFWFLRTPSKLGGGSFCAVRNNGTISNQLATGGNDGLAPCFCI